ncbi:hypothetical protein EON67_01490 [archaeon]|nr:MAG: hypothetical protein EON67_01490 [archaeon]
MTVCANACVHARSARPPLLQGRATVAETALTAERADAAASQTALQQLQRTVEERRVEVVKLTADCAALREAGATAVRMAVAKEREAAVSAMETVLRKKEGYKKALITSRTKVSALKQETAVLDEQCKALAAELAEVCAYV